jgi:hypothetical protein
VIRGGRAYPLCEGHFFGALRQSKHLMMAAETELQNYAAYRGTFRSGRPPRRELAEV